MSVAQGDFAAAEVLLLASERRMLEQLGEAAPPVRDARDRLVRLYASWNRPRELEHWRALHAASLRDS